MKSRHGHCHSTVVLHESWRNTGKRQSMTPETTRNNAGCRQVLTLHRRSVVPRCRMQALLTPPADGIGGVAARQSRDLQERAARICVDRVQHGVGAVAIDEHLSALVADVRDATKQGTDIGARPSDLQLGRRGYKAGGRRRDHAPTFQQRVSAGPALRTDRVWCRRS